MRSRWTIFRAAACVAWVLSWCLVSSCSAQAPITGCETAQDEGPVRPAAVAGGFYPASPAELTRVVDQLLAAARPPPVEGVVRALVVPHAGYVYSGSVAAHGFKALGGRKYKTVVLIGNSHHEGRMGGSVFARGKFMTPLGEVPIDEALAQKLIVSTDRLADRTGPHLPEHSLEVILPFLQRTMGSFSLVPILLGTESLDVARAVADALVRHVDDDTLIVASTDLSHYPRYEDANRADGAVIQAVLTGDPANVERTIRQVERMGISNQKTCMCGEGAVKTVMLAAQKLGADRIQLLKYANSGDAAVGSKNSVVGYAAISFSRTGGEKDANEGDRLMARDEEVVNKEEQDELLRLARLTVEAKVKTGRMPEWTNKLPGLEQKLGAFVTLKKRGELRGCIGRFEPDIPIWKVVMEMAVAAATQDTRFSPVAPGELPQLEYEISVLSPLRRVASWKEIELGKHGVEVSRGFRRGVFLPQVATETGWDLETFLSYLCAHKAGLPADAWKDPKTELYVFTAQVFGDK